jgi:hypothetical protein
LPADKISEWFSQFPAGKIPLLGSDGEKYREMQLLHQAKILYRFLRLKNVLVKYQCLLKRILICFMSHQII